MFFEERVADLTRKMLRKKFYVVLSKPAVTPDKLQPFLSAHLEYMIGLEKRGHVFASGPLADGAGPPTGPGLPCCAPRTRAKRGRWPRPTRSSSMACALRDQGMDRHGRHAGVRVNLSDQTSK